MVSRHDCEDVNVLRDINSANNKDCWPISIHPLNYHFLHLSYTYLYLTTAVLHCYTATCPNIF